MIETTTNNGGKVPMPMPTGGNGASGFRMTFTNHGTVRAGAGGGAGTPQRPDAEKIKTILAKRPYIEACRSPIAGACVDIDGDSWHKDGQRCERCGFGIDADPDSNGFRGFWGEPIE